MTSGKRHKSNSSPDAKRRLLKGSPRALAAYQQRTCDLELEISRLRNELRGKQANDGLLGRYREMFDSAPVPALVLDEMGLIHDSNSQLLLLLSQGKEQTLDGPFIRFVSKGKVADFLNHLHQARLSHGPISADLVLRTAGDGEVPVEMISVPIFNNAGIQWLQSIVLDISHRTAVKDALVRTQHDFQTLLDTTGGIFWEAAADTQEVTYMSRSVQAILGHPPQTWYQPGFWRDHIHAEDRERVVNQLARLVRSSSSLKRAEGKKNRGSSVSPQPPPTAAVLEFRMIASDRRLVWLHATITLREHQANRRLMGVAVDITQRKRAEEELQRSYAELETRIAERTIELRDTVNQLEAFSYSISHDMRAPLRSIHGFCEMLRAGLANVLNDRQRELFERIMRSTERLDRLIQDVLSYSKVSREPIDLQPVNLDRLVESIIRDYPQLKASENCIEVKRPLLPVLGNEAFLTQCLSNLLSNALKFVQPGDKPHVLLHTEPVGSDVRLWIEDSGIGINPENQKRIFSIFQRFHSRVYEGTGIGLAIVQKAVERMGGSLGVDSTPGHGSRFWFQLPASTDQRLSG